MAGTLSFICNICGAHTSSHMDTIDREIRSCTECGSTVRMRHLMQILAQSIYKRDVTIDEFLIRKDIKCLGMMDPQEFATPLAEKIDYINTFIDREPFFDIYNISHEKEEQFDFVICSEIFEHLSPPISHAFLQLKRLLKPGGSIIFTVPYNFEETTKEYFPDLFDYSLCHDDNGYYLINKTKEGSIQVFRKLNFHHGEGLALVKRDFSRSGLIQNLIEAGFTDIKFWESPYFPYGIYHPEACGYPLTAKKGPAFIGE